MSASVLRLVLGLLVAGLLLQASIDRVTDEPFPAVVGPAFASPSVNDEGAFRYRDPEVKVVFADGTEMKLEVVDLFPDGMTVSGQFLLWNTFGVGLDSSGEPLVEPSGEIGLVEPAPVAYRSGQDIPRAYEPATVEWVGRQLHALFPDRSPELLRVSWWVKTTDLDTAIAVREPSPEIQVAVRLP